MVLESCLVGEEPVKKGRHRKKLLYSSIRRQMEFYFSDPNLNKDRFLSNLLQESPNVNLETFLRFNKIRKLTSSIEDIIKALKDSEILSVSEDKTTVTRKTAVKVKTNIDDCTIYVEHIKSDTSHEWVSSIFSEFGKVVYVSIPKYKHNKLNKGFAFVEYQEPQEAQKALDYFENIGCKMSSHMEPDKLCSILTFADDKVDVAINSLETKLDDAEMDFKECEDRKRKNRENDVQDEGSNKKPCTNTVQLVDTTSPVEEESEEKKRKKHKKMLKRKAYFKELGLQILSKDEWKKMRNRYLNNQRKKMKQLKLHLRKKHHQEYDKGESANLPDAKSDDKLSFTPGVIVKLQPEEPCHDTKKTKSELKTQCPNIRYIDVQISSKEIYIRFSEEEHAKQFTGVNHNASVLQGEEEMKYWEKIQADRSAKLTKDGKKQRGKDRLLKRAERELGKHIKFEETE